MIERIDEIFFGIISTIKNVAYNTIRITITGLNDLPWPIKALISLFLIALATLIATQLYKSYKNKEYYRVKP